eukprot:CAMPEP_0204199746 /NCGR_PEP_ID=MMETSP0361-20130328/66237_1 /ASSEMBLY_ACC=CAM_ASM_000343 /TAXON_ID=268821 /ORGANISM="Scrippsiella Hangoei, Strain SHTV-5" /LENGTH=75 /DNA_ID=CAMNT_0051162087 /DNA_START=357 /DNA_END=584 /DNA_ORIENTATION=+
MSGWLCHGGASNGGSWIKRGMSTRPAEYDIASANSNSTRPPKVCWLLCRAHGVRCAKPKDAHLSFVLANAASADA